METYVREDVLGYDKYESLNPDAMRRIGKLSGIQRQIELIQFEVALRVEEWIRR